MDDVFVCPSCATESLGGYCRHCGEKRVGPRDRSLRHYLEVGLDLLVHWDSKGLRSVWLLLCRPGFLSSEYFRGSKVRYLKPLQLFVALNVVYYFSVSQFYANTFTTPLAVQLRMNDYYPTHAAHQVERKLHEDAIPYEALEKKYDAKADVLSRTLIFLFIPMFALLFLALIPRSGRSLVEHAVVAAHFWSFNLLLLGVLLPILAVPAMWILREPSIAAVYASHDGLLSAGIQVAVAVYLFLMLRRAYGIGRVYRAAVAIAVGWSFFHLVWLYRWLLFEITLRVV